jgi:hypothetical protein
MGLLDELAQQMLGGDTQTRHSARWRSFCRRSSTS